MNSNLKPSRCCLLLLLYLFLHLLSQRRLLLLVVVSARFMMSRNLAKGVISALERLQLRKFFQNWVRCADSVLSPKLRTTIVKQLPVGRIISLHLICGIPLSLRNSCVNLSLGCGKIGSATRDRLRWANTLSARRHVQPNSKDTYQTNIYHAQIYSTPQN